MANSLCIKIYSDLRFELVSSQAGQLGTFKVAFVLQLDTHLFLGPANVGTLAMKESRKRMKKK